uniref:Anti-CBASS protein Acb1-like N-terminal domain-containing protein n=1 Tax=viral metagenome TaxID=1070528 RepID=A0A6M3KWG6_9ZZZZ
MTKENNVVSAHWVAPPSHTDSWINTLSGIGSLQDKDRASFANPFERSLNRAELTQLYRDDDYAAKIVSDYPSECVRAGWTVSVDDVEGDPTEEEFQRLQVREKLKLADEWSRLYGGAAVLMGILDGQESSEPVSFDRISGISFLVVVDRWDLVPASYVSDFTSENFMEVETYWLQMHSIPGGTASNAPVVIHADRVLRFDGVKLPRTAALANQGWGDSVLQRLHRKLSRLGVSEQAMGTLIQEVGMGVWKMKGVSTVMSGPDGSKELMGRVQAAALGKSVVRAMIIDADKEDFQKIAGKYTGIEKLYDRVAQALASAADMPMTRLFRQAPGGLSTDDESGRRYWYDQVDERRRSKYEGHLICLAKYVLAADGMADAEVAIHFGALWQPTDEEKRDAQKKQAETDAIYMEWGVVTPSEVRTRLSDDDDSEWGAMDLEGDVEPVPEETLEL